MPFRDLDDEARQECDDEWEDFDEDDGCDVDTEPELHRCQCPHCTCHSWVHIEGDICPTCTICRCYDRE